MSGDPRAYDYSRPTKTCDVVMKGGITSGVVYPHAICELARTYRFVDVGGTSAGALAAVDAWGPELGVLDICLPGMDGYELATRIRNSPRTPQPKLIALTGYGRDADQDRALQSGFDAHLTKPAEPARLLDTIARLVAEIDAAKQRVG